MVAVARTTYFLGAGATKADFPQAPLGDELLHAILVGEHADSLLQNLLASIFDESAVTRDTPSERRPRLDDIFTLVDAYLAGRAPSPGTFRHEDLVAVRKGLVASIGRVIAESLPSPSGPIADRFAAHVDDGRSVIISTNYDIVMDNALFQNRNINYGVPVRSAIDSIGGRPNGEFREEDAHYFVPIYAHELVGYGKTPLLKLHGSLNWLYCPRCDELDVTLRAKGALFAVDRPEFGRCSREDCTSRYEPVLVGPSLEQRYDNRILRATWLRAERELQASSRLVIIGYSLPEADYLIRAMFARTFAEHSRFVTVVNWRDERTPSNDTSLERRYRRLFPHCTIVWDGFEGFLDSAHGDVPD
ncbi:MAG: hypothetical protein LAO51_12825 [Acidobacteriia bacterium]|nr:hypothetical protein [Terriglobia bacterium]